MHDTISRLREKRRDEGFTLIELLVVVVIIGVLVAIAVPVYLNYRTGAANKAAQSDVRGAVSAVEQYYTDNSNVYPADIVGVVSTKITFPAQAGGAVGTATVSAGTQMTFELVTATTYYICAKNTGGDKVYLYNSTTGGSVLPSNQTTVAACITAGT